MKKVLIVTYYWPPAGGPGVQRVLKFAKYLPEYGWQPIVLTVKHGVYPAIDKSLEKEVPDACRVYKTQILEPSFAYKKFIGMHKDERIPISILAKKPRGVKRRIANWIRLNLFIPDAKRGWQFFAVKEGKNILEKEKPDLIFSSSPPPTVHLIARKLSKKSGIPWIADFRDPWTDIHYYEKQPRLLFVKWLDNKYEISVLREANKITCISQLDIEADFSKKISAEKCINIPNGYDESDFKGIDISKQENKKFLLMHLGAIGNERNPINLFESIRELANEEKINQNNFEIDLIGKVERDIINTIQLFNINDYVSLIDYMPHHEALDQSLYASMMLLLITQSEKNKRILPGKTFEYLRTGKPVLALGPVDGEVARIINSTQTGKIFEYSNKAGIKEYILVQFNRWQNRDYSDKFNLDRISQYERKNLTEKLAIIFNQLIQENSEKH